MNDSSSDTSLVVYSAAERKYCLGLLDAFRSAHPEISVEFRDGISVALHERYLASLAAGKPEADLLWSSAMDLQLGLVHSDGVLAYRSAEADALPQGSIYRDRAYVTTLEPLVTLINTTLIDARQSAGSLAEIVTALSQERERLADKLACFDIERNGLGFLALMHESLHAPEFDAFMQLLTDFKPRLFGSNPELLAEVEAGRSALGFHVLGSYASRAAESNSALAVASSASPQLAISRIAVIPRTAPHPGAARCFLDFLLSRPGQLQLQRAGFGPVRTDLGSGTSRSEQSLRPIRIDTGLTELLDPGRRRAFLERWRRCVA